MKDVRFSVVSLVPVPGVAGQQISTNVAVIEQSPGEIKNGERAFQLVFNKRFVGALTLKTTVQQAKQDDTTLTSPFVKVVGAIRQHGLVAFEAYPEQQLSAAQGDIATSGLKVEDIRFGWTHHQKRPDDERLWFTVSFSRTTRCRSPKHDSTPKPCRRRYASRLPTSAC